MKIFDRFRAALRAKNPKAADLLSHVQAARVALETARVERDTLRARRAEMLTASDAERARYKAELAAAEDAAEDAALFVQELETRHGRAEALETEAARVVKRDAAQAKASAAAERFSREYAEIGQKLAELKHLMTEAGEAVRAANADLPEGAASLQEPEALVRDWPALPREIVSDTVVDRWCFIRPGSGPFSQVPIEPSHNAAKVQKTGARTGILPPPRDAIPHQGTPVELRPYRRLEYLPQELSRTGPRLADLEFPGLRYGDAPFCEPKDFGRPTSRETQAKLDAIAAGETRHAGPTRQPKVDWSPVEAEEAGEQG